MFKSENIKTPSDVLKEAEEIRLTSITVKATNLIEATYSPLKQRKLSSVAVSLLDKKISGALTDEEETLLQECRNVNIWIGSIRVIENNAITNAIPLVDVVWE